jgi:hypothetical protein
VITPLLLDVCCGRPRPAQSGTPDICSHFTRRPHGPRPSSSPAAPPSRPRVPGTTAGTGARVIELTNPRPAECLCQPAGEPTGRRCSSPERVDLWGRRTSTGSKVFRAAKPVAVRARGGYPRPACPT